MNSQDDRFCDPGGAVERISWRACAPSSQSDTFTAVTLENFSYRLGCREDQKKGGLVAAVDIQNHLL